VLTAKPPGRGLRTDEIAFLFSCRLRYVFILPGYYYGYSVGFDGYRGYGLINVKKLYRRKGGLSILIYFNLLCMVPAEFSLRMRPWLMRRNFAGCDMRTRLRSAACLPGDDVKSKNRDEHMNRASRP
jgi:hypothetical protein